MSSIEVKMTFTAYIQRQKSLIRSRREVEITRVYREEILPEYDTDTLLDELTSFKGLNTAERQKYLQIF